MSMTSQNPASPGDARETVLVIDDSPEILGIVNDLLKREYRLKAANGGEKGLALAAAKPAPDLILLDIMMPDLSGHEVCRRLKADRSTRDIPVIFLTGMNNEADEAEGFALGAVDYIAKPISGPILLARVKTHLAAKSAADFIRDKNVFLVGEVSKRAREMEFVQDVTILALASLAETRDNETGNHLRRTQHYVRALAEYLQRHPRFSLALTRTNIETICKSAPLHDIGKVGIPDHILLKPGKLTTDEWAIMQTHAKLGSDAIEKAERDIKQAECDIETRMVFLSAAKEIAHWHHEKWDGSGYPDGLAEDAIPVSARLMAIADVFDALISPRPYKLAIPFKEARDIIAAERGKHFDPELVDAFLEGFDDFVAIAKQHLDAALIAHPRWTN